MKVLSLVAIALTVCSTAVFAQTGSSGGVDPSTKAMTPKPDTSSTLDKPTTTPSQAQNPMPGKSGGFNNDEINGKSRNPDSTTPGTGPAAAAPRATQ